MLDWATYGSSAPTQWTRERKRYCRRPGNSLLEMARALWKNLAIRTPWVDECSRAAQGCLQETVRIPESKAKTQGPPTWHIISPTQMEPSPKLTKRASSVYFSLAWYKLLLS